MQAPSAIAPQSPQASIASATDAPSRMSSNVSVASTGSASLQATHYRMLTSTAAERKRTVAACRALRSQIQRFEEAFMQLHGRAPKGASERAPLATTYAQYREWKRAIRADAACRIQALVRGARIRWLLLRSSNSRLARVVMTRAGRAVAGGGKATNVSLEKLSIPMDITSEPDHKLSLLTPMPHAKKADGVDLFISGSSRQLSPVTPPSWSTSVQPRRSLSPKEFAASPSVASNSATNSDLMHMSLPDLQARKRDLKQQLKQYDMNFARKHGRMPVKAEKEPIRHVYEMYNTLKSRISTVEQQEQEQQLQKKPAAVTATQAKQHPQSSRPMQRTLSPPMRVSSASASNRLEADQSQEAMTRGSRQGSASTNNASSNKAKQQQQQLQQQQQIQQQQQQQQQQQTVYSPAPPPLDLPPPLLAGGPAHELANLKTEKAKLHQMLRSYEKDFFKEHGRQVSSFAEIKPVASQYRRYKEIKKAIAVLQLQVDGGSH